MHFILLDFLLQSNEKGEAKVISAQLMTKNLRCSEVILGLVEVVTDCRRRKKKRNLCVDIKVTLTKDHYNKLAFPS